MQITLYFFLVYGVQVMASYTTAVKRQLVILPIMLQICIEALDFQMRRLPAVNGGVRLWVAEDMGLLGHGRPLVFSRWCWSLG